jgi:hypothetical protein
MNWEGYGMIQSRPNVRYDLYLLVFRNMNSETEENHEEIADRLVGLRDKI